MKLNVKDKSVLDVGALNGDTALLFSLKGASSIVSIEPFPSAFKITKKNIEDNRVVNVKLLNCAVSNDNEGFLSLPVDEFGGGLNARLYDGKGNIQIPKCTLDSLIDKYGPFDVLKMDCEGCEYDSIPYSKRLKDFKEILIEYHNGYEILEKKLKENGFNIKFSRVKMSGNFYNKPLDPKLGYIYAVKQ